MKNYSPQPVDYRLRPCYCNLWQAERGILEKQGLPYGHCGWCGCGKPGHTRHAPDGPYTASWCDECWDSLVEKKLNDR